MSTKQKTMLRGAIIGAIIIGSICAIADPYLAFAGIWFGIGFGGNIDLIADIPDMFSAALKKYELLEAIKTIVVGSLVWFVILTMLGLIGFLVRFFKNA